MLKEQEFKISLKLYFFKNMALLKLNKEYTKKIIVQIKILLTEKDLLNFFKFSNSQYKKELVIQNFITLMTRIGVQKIKKIKKKSLKFIKFAEKVAIVAIADRSPIKI